MDPTTIMKNAFLPESDLPQVADVGVHLHVLLSQNHPPPPPLLAPESYTARDAPAAQCHPSHMQPQQPLSPSPAPQRIRDPTRHSQVCPLADHRRQTPHGCVLFVPLRDGERHSRGRCRHSDMRSARGSTASIRHFLERRSSVLSSEGRRIVRTYGGSQCLSSDPSTLLSCGTACVLRQWRR